MRRLLLLQQLEQVQPLRLCGPSARFRGRRDTNRNPLHAHGWQDKEMRGHSLAHLLSYPKDDVTDGGGGGLPYGDFFYC